MKKAHPDYVPARSPVRLTPGDMVRIGREAQEMTQAELAQVSGIRQPTLSGIEAGRVSIGVERAERLAKALKIHPAAILWPHWGEEEPAKRRRSA